MLRIISSVLILIPTLAVAAGFTPTGAPAFVPTPLPPTVTSHLTSSLNCPSNDCNNYYSTFPDDLPDPVPAAAEPAAGGEDKFCHDVNLKGAESLCAPPNLLASGLTGDTTNPVAKPTQKKKKKKLVTSNSGN